MIRNYVKGDSFKVQIQNEQSDEALEFIYFFDTIKAFTLEDENKNVLAVFGYRICQQNRAECFALIGKNIGRKMLQLVRFLRRYIPREMYTYKISKLWMTVQKGFISGVRLARIIGFYYAADLPKFYLNKDYQLFERNEKWH